MRLPWMFSPIRPIRAFRGPRDRLAVNVLPRAGQEARLKCRAITLQMYTYCGTRRLPGADGTSRGERPRRGRSLAIRSAQHEVAAAGPAAQGSAAQ
jgi:hypothetical protein